MTYSGYYQVLCNKGHLEELDCFLFEIENSKCFCGESIVFYNSVSSTNGEDWGSIDFSRFILTGEVRETCNLHVEHITQHATYRVPTNQEIEDHQTYLDTTMDEPIRRYCKNNEEVT